MIWLSGLDESHFAPNPTITREQMAILLVRAYEYKTGKQLETSDRLLLFVDGYFLPQTAVYSKK